MIYVAIARMKDMGSRIENLQWSAPASIITYKVDLSSGSTIPENDTRLINLTYGSLYDTTQPWNKGDGVTIETLDQHSSTRVVRDRLNKDTAGITTTNT